MVIRPAPLDSRTVREVCNGLEHQGKDQLAKELLQELEAKSAGAVVDGVPGVAVGAFAVTGGSGGSVTSASVKTAFVVSSLCECIKNRFDHVEPLLLCQRCTRELTLTLIKTPERVVEFFANSSVGSSPLFSHFLNPSSTPVDT
ncbi:hypothetical protein Rs2_44136 [Raphanus sativus]|nr:hypothetical protein Rs2_44136 [Raphanus sativus]